MCQNLFFMKVKTQAWNLINKRFEHKCFPVNFTEFLRGKASILFMHLSIWHYFHVCFVHVTFSPMLFPILRFRWYLNLIILLCFLWIKLYEN